MSVLRSGQQLLHYEIIEQVGAGGMGEVYRARDAKLDRSVAIKVLLEPADQDRTARRRFLQEARAASALNHPGIVTIHAIESTDDLDFIVMEYLDGESLRDTVARGPLPLGDALDLGIQTASALSAAHDAGIVHRDIKPANIMTVAEGRFKILDFGLAKPDTPQPGGDVVEPSTTMGLTVVGHRVGTIPYMSPEQTRGEPLDGRSDAFSLGCVLYEAASGRRAFDGPSALAIMHDIATVNPPPPSSTGHGLPIELDVVIQRALVKDRGHRYTAAELTEALRLVRSGTASGPSTAAASDASQREPEPWQCVGREPELRRLDEVLSQASEGRGRTVLLTGEPGIGKTTVADAFMRRATARVGALLIGRGRCVEQYGSGEAYLPFLDALGSLLSTAGGPSVAAVLRSHAPTWCLQLPAAFGSSATQEQLQRETIGATKDRMLRELGDALGALTVSVPVLLVLEDLHWADTPSVDLLRHLCQRIGDQRLAILGTFRPEEVERGDHPLKGYRREMAAHALCEEIALPMLGREPIEGYINARFSPNDFVGPLTDLIERETDGHPLFATSLIQLLLERGSLVQRDGRWTLDGSLSDGDIETPQGVRSIISKKLDALDDDARRVLQYASVAGEEFLSTVLARLMGIDDVELEERLDRLDKIDRLIDTVGEEELPDGELTVRYRFRHALYQNVLYESLVSKRRIRLHQQIGERLLEHYGDQAPRIAAPLATHFERGRDFARAVDFLVQAGDNAMGAYANAEAEALYTRALELLPRLESGAQVVKEMTIRDKRGSVNVALGRFSDAVDDLTRLVDQARAAGDVDAEFVGLRGLTQALFYSHRLDETAQRAAEALAVAERSETPTRRVEVMNLVNLKQLCYGELPDARSGLDQAIDLARSIGSGPALAGALAWRGGLYFWQTDYAAAETVLDEAVRLTAELRDGFHLVVSLFFTGLARGNQGRMSEALEALNKATAMARRNGDLFWRSRLPNCIGWIHRELRDFEVAAVKDQEGVDVAKEHAVIEAQANSLINLGLDYTETGHHGHTMPAFREVEEIFARDAWFRWRYNIRLQAGLGEHWLTQNEPDKADDAARRLRDVALEYEAWKYVAVADSLRGRAAIARGDLPGGVGHLDAPLDQLRDHPCPIAAWKINATLGRVCRQLGEGQRATTAFDAAAAIVHGIAGHVDDDALRSTFLESSAVREVIDGAGTSS